MDISTILGMVFSITSISVGDILEGGNPLHVLNLSSVLIVVPTAMFSSMTATNKKYIKATFQELKIVFKGSGVDMSARIAELVEYSTLARKNGIFKQFKMFKNGGFDIDSFKAALLFGSLFSTE